MATDDGTVTTRADAAAVPAQRGPGAGPRHAAVEPELAPWRRSWQFAGFAWVATHLVFAIATVLHRALGASPEWQSALENWRQWDAWSYARIATSGYGSAEGDAAFFPLYPLLARAVDGLLPSDATLALLVVSNLCGLGALVLLHRLLVTEAGVAVADRTVFLFGVFPTAYFLAAPYNHSLFLLLTLGFLYALRRRVWWLAAVLGALASATRSAGVLLVLPFVFEYLRVRGFQPRLIRPGIAWVLAIPAGLVAYAVYCWQRLGDPLAFSHAQSLAVWDRTLSWPGQVVWDAVARLREGSLTENYPIAADLAGTLLGVALIVACLWGPWALRRDQWALVVCAAPILLLPLFVAPAQGNPVLSNARLLLDGAILFVVLGRALSRLAYERLYVLVAISLQFGFTLMYLRGDWTF
jgi:hypothetical protein